MAKARPGSDALVLPWSGLSRVTLELWNTLKLIHEFTGMTALGAFAAALVTVIQGRRMASDWERSDGFPTQPVLSALNRWLAGPSLVLMGASGLGMALTNSYRLSPAFILTSTIAMILATLVWVGVMLPAEAHFRPGRHWQDGWTRWITGWLILAALVLFSLAVMVIRPVWWVGVSAFSGA